MTWIAATHDTHDATHPWRVWKINKDGHGYGEVRFTDDEEAVQHIAAELARLAGLVVQDDTL